MDHAGRILEELIEAGICPTLPQNILQGRNFPKFEENVLPINVQDLPEAETKEAFVATRSQAGQRSSRNNSGQSSEPEFHKAQIVALRDSDPCDMSSVTMF